MSSFLKDNLQHLDNNLFILTQHQDILALPPNVRELIQLVVMYVQEFGRWQATDGDDGPKGALILMVRSDFTSIYRSLVPID